MENIDGDINMNNNAPQEVNDQNFYTPNNNNNNNDLINFNPQQSIDLDIGHENQKNITLNETNNPEDNQYGGVVNIPESEKPKETIRPSEVLSAGSSTLDEPIMVTLKRDIFRIYNKLKHVVNPFNTESKKIEELYNWDLWGPLIFCFLLSISLSTGDHSNDESSLFVLIFVIFWVGGLIIAFNGQFLGANVGVCQMICLLGYCMFPITIGGMIIGFLKIKKIWAKTLIVLIGGVWACISSIGFVSGLVVKEKRFLNCLPIFLFFLTLALFVLNY